MRSKHTVFAAIALSILGACFQSVRQNQAEASGGDRKIRVTNNSDTGVRFVIDHFNPNIRLVTDVNRGLQELYPMATPGNRGVIIYETLNEKVIAHGEFTLKPVGNHIDVIIIGDSTNGYRLVFNEFQN